MEGSYQKAWGLLEAGSAVPELDVFSKTLMEAIRDEIAMSTELAYESLPLMNVKTLLFFNTEKNAETFALERGWEITNSTVYFHNKERINQNVVEEEIEEQDGKANMTGTKLAQFNLIKKTMDYAVNIETII